MPLYLFSSADWREDDPRRSGMTLDENAGSGRLPHGFNLVPRQMDNGHTFTAPILLTSDRAKPSASSWNAGISICIIAITHDARWEGV